MVFSAAGVPLYLPPRRREPEVPLQDPDFAKLLQAEDGMQSLLSAIELDMSRTPLALSQSDGSLQSSMVASPDHHDLMAALLDTTFLDKDTQAAAATIACSSLGDEQDEIETMTLPSFDDALDWSSEGTLPMTRNWTGLPSKWHNRHDREQQIKAVIAAHMLYMMDPAAALTAKDNRLTRIRFVAPSVAQKSYGQERRLLVPFPKCSIEGAFENLCGRSARVFLSISAGSAGTLAAPEEEAILSTSGQANFKSLYVNSQVTGKAKSVKLKLNVAQKNGTKSSDIPLLEVTTPEIMLLSKPSKSSMRLKLRSSFIYKNTAVALFSRLNSQTARTRYLGLEGGNHLCAWPDTWSSFLVHEYKDGQVQYNGPVEPLLCGTIIVLREVKTNFTSAPMVVRRVDAKGIVDNIRTPVSQMHKIVLEEYRDGLQAPPSKSFLSAKLAHKPALTREWENPQSFLTTFETAENSSQGYGPQVADAGHWTMVGLSFYETSFIDALSDLPLPEPPIKAGIVGDAESEESAKDAFGPAGNKKRSFDKVVVGSGKTRAANKKRSKSRPDCEESDDVVQEQTMPPLDCSKDEPSTTEAESSQSTSRDALKSPTATSSSSLPSQSASPPRPAPPSTSTSTLTSTTKSSSQLTIQTPLSPLPSLAAAPIYLHSPNRIEISVKDYWQTSSCLINSEIYLGPHGPCKISKIIQSATLFTDAVLEIELPCRADVDGQEVLPLLFVREDGVIVLANYSIVIPPST